MNHIAVLEEIVDELERIARIATDKYIIAAAQANLIKYKRELELAEQQNAMDIIEYKITHLIKKLK